MSDSDDSCDIDFILYKDRLDWKDVVPIPQDDGPNPVVVIAYSQKFSDCYDYFRAIIKKNEKSQRALNLTKDALELNPANYTVWQYRRELLQALNSNLTEELEYVGNIIMKNPKNYQVWHHRRVIVEWMKDASSELKMTADVLLQDAKNYHAWQHRQWVLKAFNLFENEIQYVETLINNDVRNNSAWNQRYFVVDVHVGWADIVVQNEIAYTINKIRIALNNESAWNYLRGIMTHDKRGLSGNSVVNTFCEELYKNKSRSPYLLGFIVDICEDSLDKGKSDCIHSADRAIQLCKMLAEKHDTIRCKYWNYISEKFKVYSQTKGENGVDSQSNSLLNNA